MHQPHNADTLKKNITRNWLKNEKQFRLEECKSLGVIVDQRWSFKTHVNTVPKASNSAETVAHTLVRNIVMSKHDYCNANLYESTMRSMGVLQRTQNSLTHIS